jgi:hypothetical protein
MATATRRQTLGPLSTNNISSSRMSLGPASAALGSQPIKPVAAAAAPATAMVAVVKSARQSMGGRMSLAPRPMTARQSLGGSRNSAGRCVEILFA